MKDEDWFSSYEEELYESDPNEDDTGDDTEFEDWDAFEGDDIEEPLEVDSDGDSSDSSGIQGYPHAESDESTSNTSSSNSEDDVTGYFDKLDRIEDVITGFVSLDSKDYKSLHYSFTKSLPDTAKDSRLLLKFIDVICQVVLCSDTKKFSVSRRKYKTDSKILCKDFKLRLTGYSCISKGSIDYDSSDISLRYFILTHATEDIELSEYLQTRRYLQDIDLLYFLIADTSDDEEWNQQVLQDIIENSPNLPASRGQCVDKVNAVLDCLELMYSSTFDLHPFPGVFLFGGMAEQSVSGRSCNSSQDVIFRPEGDAGLLRPVYDNIATAEMYHALAEALQGYQEFQDSHISYERMYHYDEIMSGHKYIPFASFAYATGCIVETEYYKPSLEDIVYRRSKATSWSEYVSGVSGEDGLRVRLTTLMSQYIYKALEKYGKFKFTDGEFKRLYEQEGAAKAYAVYTQGTALQIASAVKNFIRSICTACVLSRNDDNLLFKVKICTFENDIKKNSTARLFNSVYFTNSDPGVSFSDANVIKVNSVSCTIYEFSFCRQQELMDSRPLFGYEAARLFQKQNRMISYDNILIGEDNNGNPLFSTQGGIVNLQGHIAHRLSAGSRSGKGVMTMNILASAVSSGAALFYIDRKPDMGSELAHISRGNMFLVNGGDIQPGEDTHKCFIKGDNSYGFMLEGYEGRGKESFKYPYLTAVFGSDFGDKWKDAFGDLIYMKAMIFCLSLIAARMHFVGKSLSEADSRELGMDRNVVVVMDEITNWHHKFESQYFPSDPYNQERTKGGALHKYYSSTLGKVSAGDSTVSEIKDKLKKDSKAMLPEYQAKYEAAQAALSAAKDEDKDKAIKAFNSAKSALDKAIKEAEAGAKAEKDLDKKLYWSTFFDKYASSLEIIASIRNAGIKPEHTSMNDVFMIGQFISGVPNTRVNEPIAYTSSGDIAKVGSLEEEEYRFRNSNVPTEDLDRSYMLGFAEIVGCDWFTGRNLINKDDVNSARYPNFGGSNLRESNPELDNWLHTRGNWIYIPDGSQKDFRQGAPDMSRSVMFKPYLVLNTNDEPKGGDEIYTESYRKEHNVSSSIYKYVYGVADRVGIKSWKELRKSHVKYGRSPGYGFLEDGIGLRGLIEEYKRTEPGASNWVFEEDCLSASKMMADSICRRFGYSDYMDYLLDLSPKGIIGAQDIIDAYEVQGYAEDSNLRLSKMFPRYLNTGNMKMLTGVSDMAEETGNSKKFFGFGVMGEENPVEKPNDTPAAQEGWNLAEKPDKPQETEIKPQSVQRTASEVTPSDIDVSFTWDHDFRLKVAASFADYALKVANRLGNAELRQLCIDRAYKDLVDRGY